ncbi:hypothetical protein FOMA001_g16705 [Fusarium oxysporum f. sp. matthiolae]|nr:hypothetical protein FOMA001_g16705 [Fusarium oxysporum f. sp. matthiolae]
MVGQAARRGSTIVIESSVAVGMTRELVGPIAKRLALFAGMSPEVRDAFTPSLSLITMSLTNSQLQRVDPGRTEPPVKSIPKIISGLDDHAQHSPMSSSPDGVLTCNPQFSSYLMLRCKSYDVASLSHLSGWYALTSLGLSCVKRLAEFHDDAAHRHIKKTKPGIPPQTLESIKINKC